MATTNEDVKNNEDAYAAGFNEDTPAKPEQTEDEAFGLGMDVEEAAAADAEQSSGDGAPLEDVVLAADAGADDAAGAGAGEGEGEGEGGNAGGMAEDAAVDEPTDPKDIQRKKSWEGRLKAEETRLAKVREELEAKAAAAGKPTEEVAGDALDQVADQAESQGDAAMAAKVEETADKVDSGEMSAEDAMKSLSEDFGEPFVKMIAAIAKSAATSAAGKEIGEIKSTIRDVIDDIKDTKARSHFAAIESAHPDFVEIAKDPAFDAWKAEDPERARIADGGTAAEINAMLTEWKSQAGAGGEEVAAAGADAAPEMAAEEAPVEQAAADDSVPEDELDAAEGVRSAGMQLPEEPAAADDYAGAWEEFAAKDRPRA